MHALQAECSRGQTLEGPVARSLPTLSSWLSRNKPGSRQAELLTQALRWTRSESAVQDSKLELKAERELTLESFNMQSSCHHIHWQPYPASGIHLTEPWSHPFRALSLWLLNWCHAHCFGTVQGPVFGLLKQSHVLEVRMEAC